MTLFRLLQAKPLRTITTTKYLSTNTVTATLVPDTKTSKFKSILTNPHITNPIDPHIHFYFESNFKYKRLFQRNFTKDVENLTIIQKRLLRKPEKGQEQKEQKFQFLFPPSDLNVRKLLYPHHNFLINTTGTRFKYMSKLNRTGYYYLLNSTIQQCMIIFNIQNSQSQAKTLFIIQKHLKIKINTLLKNYISSNILQDLKKLSHLPYPESTCDRATVNHADLKTFFSIIGYLIEASPDKLKIIDLITKQITQPMIQKHITSLI
ncbi:uncharacterized protein SCDLUD_004265 [Saccharomycodes ludwigii]|uniref:uncharacterized protein n=1 Tax=Saccharomycodes ludwigii TaxID=36035 RepID=UPI001E8974B2|nr:hypothetical protein SCDLUD_004265 [Saccharomycodes ludwigii]KAH3899949.1 hypothetical protein SCDLUD_004265 [Saccharomycodes ludwigii]